MDEVNNIDNPYTSDELFHFCGQKNPLSDEENFSTLIKILSLKCISHPPHRVGWGEVTITTDYTGSVLTENLVMPNMTCYADIPFKGLSWHTKKYGKFGLSLPKKLLAERHARPVTYIPYFDGDWTSNAGRVLIQDIENTYKGIYEHFIKKDASYRLSERYMPAAPKNRAEAIYNLDVVFNMHILAFIKPFNLSLPVGHVDSYYMEREWRKFGNMMFKNEELKTVVLASGYKRRFIEKFPEFSDRIVEI